MLYLVFWVLILRIVISLCHSLACGQPGFLCNVHITLQELHAVALILHKLDFDFDLYCKVVALHLCNSSAKTYLYNQGITLSLSVFRLACCI